MNKKGKLLRILIYMTALGIFGWYEYQLHLNYVADEKVRVARKIKTTRDIEESFLIRKDGFYLDKEYIKAVEEQKEKEKLEESSNVGGEESLEQQHKDLQ